MSISTLIAVVCCFPVQLVCANLANLTTAMNCATEATPIMATAGKTPLTPTNCTSYPPSRGLVSCPATPVSEIPHTWTNLASHHIEPASETPPTRTNPATTPNRATKAITTTATPAETPLTPTSCTSYPLSGVGLVPHPTTPICEISHGWTNLTAHSTAPASETLHS